MANESILPVNTPANQASGALASVTGFFRDVVQQATPAVQSYFDYRAQRENAKTASSQAQGVSQAGAGADWRGTVAPGGGITSQPWFLPAAIAGGVLLLGGGLLLLLRGGKK